MITLPGDIQQDPSWDGRTGFDKHLESEMDFEEHQRVAFNALQLLAGNLAVADNAAGKKLEELKEAYEGGYQEDVLYISKGIHQPNTNPHMQLKLKRGNKSYTYHLNVSVSDVDIPGLNQGYFHWIGVQFTADADSGKVNACWPLAAAHDTKYRRARRRWSIAPKDVQSTIAAIARARQEEQDRADRVEQARLAESNKAKARNVITAQLKSQKWTIPGNKTTGMNKLIDGETIEVTTLRAKKVKVKFVGGQVKQA
jgi:hypothetical protein